MKKVIKWVLFVAIVVLSFVSNPNGPLGGFWRPDSMSPTPTNIQLPFFLILNLLESITFASAVVLLVFNFPKKAFYNLTLRQTRIAYICFLWFLGNWWTHDSLHIHNGMNLQGLLFIEYGFHVTMMIAAAYLLLTVKKLSKSK